MMTSVENKKKLKIELEKEINDIIKKCYSCGKCTCGCPVAGDMEFTPRKIVRWLAMGEIEKILKSKAIWVCSTCQTCVSRCPFEVDIPRIIDLLKEYAQRNKLTNVERPTRLFHDVFLSNIQSYGRIHEGSFIGKWKILSGKLFSDLGLGFKMAKARKLSLIPEKINNIKQLKDFFKKRK